jgi:hypothetical protein
VRSVVVHLHLSQPPREDPWLGEIEREPEAAPDHDWTARMERTCYRPLAAARLLDAEGRIRRVVDTLALTSFDAAPTLLAWMADQAPATYAAVLNADRASRARLGHGNALAHPYDHALLPLLSRRDKETEVRWGIADFRRRFGRDPDGMWCPETAVDDETLDVLAAHGIRFTIVAPHQLATVPADGRPGRYRTGGGHEIALAVYDDALAREVAFGGALRDGRSWARRLADDARADADAAADADAWIGVDAQPTRLTSVATAAEVYGHHHAFGEMALAAMLDAAGTRPHAQVENYASALARRPADQDVTLVGPSSWSCPHGVERWRRDCGCRADPTSGQGWRAPLRAAVEALQQALHERFVREGTPLFGEAGVAPWPARDAYLDAGVGAVPATHDPVWARELLEMEREALRLHTSSAFFGDTLDRPEVRMLLRHAARALALAGPNGPQLERRFLQALDAVPGEDEGTTAGDLYVAHGRPALPAAVRVAAGWAAARAVGLAGETAIPDAWRVHVESASPDDVRAPGHEALLSVADRRLGRRHASRCGSTYPDRPVAGGAARSHDGAAAAEGAPYRLADVDPRASRSWCARGRARAGRARHPARAGGGGEARRRARARAQPRSSWRCAARSSCACSTPRSARCWRRARRRCPSWCRARSCARCSAWRSTPPGGAGARAGAGRSRRVGGRRGAARRADDAGAGARRREAGRSRAAGAGGLAPRLLDASLDGRARRGLRRVAGSSSVAQARPCAWRGRRVARAAARTGYIRGTAARRARVDSGLARRRLRAVDHRPRSVTTVLFAAPLLSDAASRMVRAVGGLPAFAWASSRRIRSSAPTVRRARPRARTGASTTSATRRSCAGRSTRSPPDSARRTGCSAPTSSCRCRWPRSASGWASRGWAARRRTTSATRRG